MIKYIFRYNKRQWFNKWSSVKLIPQYLAFTFLIIWHCLFTHVSINDGIYYKLHDLLNEI